MNKFIIFITIFQIALITSGYSATYYVATDGKQSNPGTLEKPWDNLTYAAGKTKPGDVVYVRGGVYRQMFTISNSGNADNWITFKNYNDEKVNIWFSVDLSNESDWIHQGGNLWYTADGSFKQSINYDVSTIWYDDHSHWSYKKLDANELKKQWDFYHNYDAGRLEVFSTSNPATLAEHIEVPRSPATSPYQFVTTIYGSYIVLDGFHYKYMNVHGIDVNRTHHIIFRNGSISHGGGGNIAPGRIPRVRWGDCVDVTGNSHHVWFENSVFGEYVDGTLTNQGNFGKQQYLYFRNNYIYKSTNGIHCWLGYENHPNPFTELFHVYYEGNTFEDIGRGWYEDQAVMVGGIHIVLRENVKSEHVYIRDNVFIKCGTTLNKGDTWKGVNCPINIGGGNITIANNIIYNSPSEGIHVKAVHQKFTGSIYNNLIYNCNWSGIRFNTNSAEGAAVYNNTIYNCGDDTHPNVHVMNNSDVLFANNIFSSEFSTKVENESGDFDYNCYSSMSPIGSYGIMDDPLFVDPDNADFHLDPASPCIDTGTTDLTTDVDLDSLPRPSGNGIDMGAFEYQDPTGIQSENRINKAEHTLSLKIFPNPGIAGRRISLQVNGFAGGSVPVMRIYDILGRLVKEMNIVTAPGATIIWDGTNHFNNPVASGKYFITIRNEQAEIKQSIILLNH